MFLPTELIGLNLVFVSSNCVSGLFCSTVLNLVFVSSSCVSGLFCSPC